MHGLRGKGIKNKDWFAGHYEPPLHHMLYGGNGIYFKLTKRRLDLYLNGHVAIYSTKNIKSTNALYCDRLREVSAFLEFFLIKFFKEYLKFYTPQKLWIFFPNRCISYLSISRFYSRKWYLPLCKSRSIN